MSALADFADDLLVTEPGSPERAVVLLDHAIAQLSTEPDVLGSGIETVASNVADLGQVLKNVRTFLRTPNVAKTLKTKDPGLSATLAEAFTEVQVSVSELKATHQEVMRIE